MWQKWQDKNFGGKTMGEPSLVDIGDNVQDLVFRIHKRGELYGTSSSFCCFFKIKL